MKVIKSADVYIGPGWLRGDVLIDEGIVKQISSEIDPPEHADVIDAEGLWLLPGAIDVHTHFGLEVMDTVTSDDFFSGTRAAAAGGTTTVIDFVHPARGESYLEALESVRAAADPRVVTDYGLHLAVTWYDKNKSPALLADVIAEGVTSFKVYLAYLATVGITDAELYGVLETAKELEALVMAHAEDGELIESTTASAMSAGLAGPLGHAAARPFQAEVLGTTKLLSYASVLDMPVYVVHVSCSEVLSVIHRFRGLYHRIAAETCPQYLLLYDILYEKMGWDAARYVLTPPLRKTEDNFVLWAALRHDQIQTIGSDHCSFLFEGQKDLHGREDFTRIPGGIPGVQDRLELIYSYGVNKHLISAQQWLDSCCAAPARLFGLYPNKGVIAEGSDADLVLFDPSIHWTIHTAERRQKVDYSAYEGFPMEGKVVKVYSRGELIHDDDWTTEEAGRGRFLARGTSSLYSDVYADWDVGDDPREVTVTI